MTLYNSIQFDMCSSTNQSNKATIYFNNRINKRILNTYEQYYIFTKFKYLKDMHSDEKVKNNDEEQNVEEDTHEYNCQCSNCRDKYGNLPLLVRVIEENQERTSKETKTTPKIEDINQPSTSSSITSHKTRKEICCTECDKKFSHRGDFNKHLRKHTGEKPYNCDICHKKFAHTSNLSRHLLLHSGVKPFQCNVCNKKFSRKDKLISHQKCKSCKKE